MAYTGNWNQRIDFNYWNEFVNTGKRFNCRPMKSGLTRDLDFIDRMLNTNKIDEFEHQKLRVKLISDWTRYYQNR